MSEGKRPGGLTALAVINFVLGGFSALSLLGYFALFAIMSGALPVDEGMLELKTGLDETGMGVLVMLLVLSAITSALMITAGVGYLKQKQFLGRTLGNAYAGLALVETALGVAMIDPAVSGVSGGFGIATIIDLIYPVLTLLLLNTTFKEDFTE